MCYICICIYQGKIKFLLAYLLAGVLTCHLFLLQLNASDDRGIGIVRGAILSFASTRTIFKYVTAFFFFIFIANINYLLESVYIFLTNFILNMIIKRKLRNWSFFSVGWQISLISS